MAFTTSASADEHLHIVTDIAPVHSLVSMVVGERTDVTLLVPPSQSPHTFSLKPSQVRAMNKAQLIIMLSDKFTPGLSRHTNSLNKDVVVLQLSNPDNTDHEAEPGTNANNSEHEQHEEHDPHKDDRLHEHDEDPHTWLNVQNAIEWIDLIEAAAIEVDAASAKRYEQNATKAKIELSALHNTISKQLADVQSRNYVVYHDAYQHFAQGYGLTSPISIALSDARAPGAARIKFIQAQLKNATCIFAETQHDDSLVDMVATGQSIKRGVLDPIGSSIDIGTAHYINTMQALATSFSECLRD